MEGLKVTYEVDSDDEMDEDERAIKTAKELNKQRRARSKSKAKKRMKTGP